VAISSGTPSAARTTNTPRQDVNSSTWPPISGASTGATPVIPISSANMRAAVTPPDKSRTIARAMTIPKPPAIPCTSRAPTRNAIDGAAAQAAEANA
jgi:hypothetical protein